MIYKSIPNFEQYEISENGDLRSKDRTIVHKNGKKFKVKLKNITWKLPKGAKYYQVVLYNNGRAKLFRIHRLVALSWIPNPYNYPNVNHKDGNKLNNHKDNLEWVTRSQNVIHCKQVLGKNMRVSYLKLLEIHEQNKNINLKDFLLLIKQYCT